MEDLDIILFLQIIRQQSTARDLTIYERFVAGSLAGGFSQTVIYPLEVGEIG